MGVKERLREYIKSLHISEREFCKRIGVSASYVNAIRNSIQPDKMKAICEEFPDLNPTWLLLGEGDMLKTITQTSHGDNSPNIAGNGNTVNMPTLDKALDEIAEMRKLTEMAQSQISKSQEQIDRLISVIEKLSEK